MNGFVKGLCLLSALAILAAGQQADGAETSTGVAVKAAPKAIPISGTVLETMDGGGYTYLLLKNGGEKTWVAAPLMKVSVGQQMTLVSGFEMKNFSSKGLNRKFDRIIFSAGVADNQKLQLSPSAIKMAHQGVPVTATPAPARNQGKPVARGTERVAKAKGPNAYTIAQLYAKKMKLEKKPVVVRGRVVKVSPGILKRNWIHIQDGSGAESKKNHNLIITTKDLPKVGELVTARGTLYNNMDFGSGYRYGLLIEGARFR